MTTKTASSTLLSLPNTTAQHCQHCPELSRQPLLVLAFKKIKLLGRSKILLFTSLLSAAELISFSPAQAGYEWKGSVESLISTVLRQAEMTVGVATKSPPVSIAWCRGTFYNSRKAIICLEREFIYHLATKVGDAAVAYVVAHEYAHHIQYSVPGLLRSSSGNPVRIELQADCFAGIILAAIPGVSFDKMDMGEILLTALLIGDQEYDSKGHHGTGESRALAIRSGIRFGSNLGKDNYYGLFCRPDQ